MDGEAARLTQHRRAMAAARERMQQEADQRAREYAAKQRDLLKEKHAGKTNGKAVRQTVGSGAACPSEGTRPESDEARQLRERVQQRMSSTPSHFKLQARAPVTIHRPPPTRGG